MESKALKRRTLTLSEKIDIIRKFDSQYSLNKKEFADSINIPESSLRTILRNRDDIEKHATTGSAKRKKVKAGKYEELEKILYKWFNEVRSLNIPINGPIIKEKASEIAQHLEIQFNPSNGWLDRFKNRHGIIYKSCGVEAVQHEETNTDHWNSVALPDFKKKYGSRDIYNVDELGLFFKLTPDQSKMYKEEKCPRGEFSDDRVTILIGSNSDGTDKLKPLVIGRPRSPMSFRNVKSLPCDYKSQNQAWLTGDIFVSWLRDFDHRVGAASRKVVLFVDHSPAHLRYDLRNVRVEFLPDEPSQAQQPMTDGVIQALRQNYRKRIIHRFLDDKEHKGTPVTHLDALHYISAAWNDVEPRTIRDSFQKSRLTTNLGGFEEMDGPMDLSDTDDYWRAICDRLGTTLSRLEDYIYVDEDIFTSEMRGTDVTDRMERPAGMEPNEEEKDVDFSITDSVSVPTVSSVMEAFSLVRRYASSLDASSSEEIFSYINAAESAVMRHRRS